MILTPLHSEHHTVEGIAVQVHYYSKPIKDELLLEAMMKGRHLVGRYSFRKDKPHNPTGQYHIHVYEDSNEIFAINQDGTAHDGYHGVRIPNDVFRAVQQKWPNWNWPTNQIIECLITSETILFDQRLGSLRPVFVSEHRRSDGTVIENFLGFFHQLGSNVFLAGGQGFITETVAIVETYEGKLLKVSCESLYFQDIP